MDQGIADAHDLIASKTSVEYENVWAAGTAYQAGDVVEHNGVEYLAVNPSTGETPPAVQVPVGYDTTLPSSPVDGQEAILVDSLIAPTYQWRFKYIATITDANKWVFIGGDPALAEVLTAQTTTSTTYAALTTPGPLFAIPRAGIYTVETGFTGGMSAGVPQMYMSFDIGATPAADTDWTGTVAGTAGHRNSVARARQKTLTAVTLTAKYKVVSGTGSFEMRWMRVTPKRVA